MSGIWRKGVVVLAAFAVAWACAIFWWRSADTAPGGMAMLGWLVALPLALLGLLWIVARARRRSGRPQPQADGEAAEEAVADAPVAPPLMVLAEAAWLPWGDGTLAGSLAGLPRPTLHPALCDRDGFPVLAAFDPGLDTVPLEQQFSQGSARRWAPEQLRALALLEPVALELFGDAARLLPRPPKAPERVVAGLRRVERSDRDNAGRVRIVALLPREWDAAQRDACEEWLRGLAAGAGLDPRRSRFEVEMAEGEGAAWPLIAGLHGKVEGDAARDWLLVLAASSLVGPRAVRALESAGKLARYGNPEGLVPGEGAAGLLLAPHGATPAGEIDAGLSLAALRFESVAADGKPREAARASTALLQGVMADGGVEPAAVATVVGDADQRPSRAAEAAVAVVTACPDLDPVDDCPAIGSASGHLGQVAPLALLALAGARARAADAPALVLSVSAKGARAAALVQPAAAAIVAGDVPAAAGTPGLAA